MRSSLVALVLVSLVGCHDIPVQRRDWSKYEGPGREYFLAEEVPFVEIRDPLEPANRVLAFVNDALLRYLLAPAGRGYRFVVPRGVRQSLRNFGENLRYPRRLANNLLQGKWSGSWDETRRFALNSTVGVLGLFDPASSYWRIPESDEDFGRTFARAGWRDSTYLFVPLVGPTTLRDGLGGIGDLALSPLTYVEYASAADRFNDNSDDFEGLLRATDANYDAYQFARVLYVLTREVDATNLGWSGDDSGEVETLAAAFLAPKDPTFADRRAAHEVHLFRDDRALTYNLWLQPAPASIVYLLPGLGTHRLNDSALALAEVVYGFGASVVCISSTMSFEFMQNGASTPLPGNVPVDALDVHHALDAIHADLERRHPGHAEGLERVLAGVSLGGAHALHIAAAEGERELVDFDVYVAVDPPVSLSYAANQLDAFYNAPLAIPAADRDEQIREIFGKVIELVESKTAGPEDLPFTQLEAEFLIGLSFRATLQTVLLASQERYDMGVLMTERTPTRMAPAFREASEYSFLEYFYGFLLPYYAMVDESITLDEDGAARLFASSDLRAVEARLRANERVRVFANSNDFLLGAQDREWLRATLGERAIFFEDGGHLGNLHRAQVQNVIESVVRSTNHD